MPKGKFDYYDVPGFVVGMGGKDTVSYRFESTGRGKSTVERWQRRKVTPVSLDGYSATDAIEAITEAAVGLEDTYVDNVAKEEYGDLPWVETTVTGWVDVVSGSADEVKANEEIYAVKKHVTKVYEESQDTVAHERAKAEAEIKSLAYRYPDLVAQYAPRATAS